MNRYFMTSAEAILAEPHILLCGHGLRLTPICKGKALSGSRMPKRSGKAFAYA
jgi:hypothetical protein